MKLLFLLLILNCNLLTPISDTRSEIRNTSLLSLLNNRRTNHTTNPTCNSGSTCSSPPCLNVCFQFSSTQERLGNTGNITNIPFGNAGQNPDFKLISAHYYELSQTETTLLGNGSIIFQPATVVDTTYSTSDARRNAFHFNDLKRTKEYEIALSVPIKNITPASYRFFRISLAFQEYDVSLRVNNTSVGSIDFKGRLSSFVGVNTYITSYTNNDETITLNSFRSQGYWYFNPDPIQILGTTFNSTSSTGQAPGTTVVNPLYATSPIPSGSCVVTNSFDSPLVITGNETKDINIVASLSTNKSFEWRDLNNNGIWEPVDSESVVDMGLRGVKFFVNR
jgi:hypothetical protein